MVIGYNCCNIILNYMGNAVTCVRDSVMSLFTNREGSDVSDKQAQLERKLYLAKESPEPIFDLSESGLREVPSGIYSICKVYRKDQLYLNGNKLKSLNGGGQLSDLYLVTILNISHNKFSKLSSDIKYLVNLRELYVQNNFLEYIPETIQFLENLQIIDASRNLLKAITPALGNIRSLRKLKLNENHHLSEICLELCYASNLILIEIDAEQFSFPPSDVCTRGTKEIMKFLCEQMSIDYIPPTDDDIELPSGSVTIYNPFMRKDPVTWEQQEAAIVEQEQRIHRATKEQREKFLYTILQEQHQLDTEIAKVHGARDLERQILIRTIQEDEKEIECLIRNFTQTDKLNPEIIQQQLAYEQAEHDRILEITRQSYDNIKKAEVLKAMEKLLEENYSNINTKRSYEDKVEHLKQNMLLHEFHVGEKLEELLKVRDQSRTVLLEQLLDDQDVQKAVVASLIEQVDSRAWSLNQEIALISSHLAKLSVIEQEKRKLEVSYNYTELLNQRMQLVILLDDLYVQQDVRRKQLLQTLKDMEDEKERTTDFWLKNYQKLIDSVPRNLLNIGKSLDPHFANCLLEEGVIHCLPFLVKFLFSNESLLNLTLKDLKENGVTLSSDREGIMKAINDYVQFRNKNVSLDEESRVEPTAPMAADITPTEPAAPIQDVCNGIVNTDEAEETILTSECIVCMDANCEAVFVPCGHMCCCQICANQQTETCPMCRTKIERVIRVIVS